MRTLSEMIERVKTHVRAAENLTWANADYESALVEAARRMWRHIAKNPGGSVLRAFSENMTVPDGGVLELPADCLSLETVDYLGLMTRNVFTPIPYAPPDDRIRGPFRPFCSMPAWTNDQPDGRIRVMGVKPGATVRFVYLQEPIFPSVGEGTFRRPDGGETDIYPNLPEMCDSACEHFAAALMSGEELRDDAPIGYHGQQYTSMLNMISKSRRAMPSRRYVRHVGGWK